MNRIAYMVLRNLLHAPVWFYKICKMGRPEDTHTEQERYEYLRRVVTRINHNGRVTVESSGTENLPEKDGFILFPNHQGLFDSLAFFESCPRPLGIIIKKEATEWFLVKQVVALIHGIPMDRSDIRASMAVISQMTEEVKQGRNFIIFPEGTRSRDGNHILAFKAGSFKSAVNANCPIVPVAMIDSFRPFDIPSIKREKVKISYLDPIYPEEYAGMKTREIAQMVHDRIEAEIKKQGGISE